jgi:hypothetical protein
MTRERRLLASIFYLHHPTVANLTAQSWRHTDAGLPSLLNAVAEPSQSSLSLDTCPKSARAARDQDSASLPSPK